MSGSVTNLYRCSPRQVRQMVPEILYAGLVPFIKSSPGLGKSSIVRSTCDELNLAMIDQRISGSEPTDFTGLPKFVGDKARFVPFDELFPVRGTELPKGKDGWMIFLDEFNSGARQTMAASYKLLLDRMTGQQHLHDNVVIACAGNLESDRAIVNQMGTALQSRVVTLEMSVEGHESEWIEDVAIPQKYDSRIIAYLSQYPSKLMDFRPDHNEKTFCSPRTWEFMNRLIQGKEVLESKTAMYAGTITSGVAVEFVQFVKVFDNLISVKEILADPENCNVPYDNSTRWATICHMLEKMDEKNIGGLTTYASRFDLSFRILFLRAINIQHEDLLKHPAVAKARLEMSKYLHS